MAVKTFQFRMASEGAEQVIADLRKAAVASAEAQRALTALTQASPQLASVQDGVQAKLRGTTAALKDATSSAYTFGGALKMGGGFGAGFAAVTTAINTIVASVSALPKAGDAATESIARLNAVVGDTAKARVIFNDLTALSRQTGVAVTDSASTFGRFAIAAKDLGVTNAQIVELVGGVQKFGIVAGATTEETKSATIQLSQALASGVLQGDELRSILESMPQLAQALAKQLDTSIGNLRTMGAEGKLTSDVVMPALLRAVQGIDAEFAKMPLSMARAQQQFDVAATSFLAHIDEAIGLSAKLAGILERSAGFIDKVRKGAGGASMMERQASLIDAQPAIQGRIAGFDQMIADTRNSGVLDGDPALKNLIKSRDAIAAELAKNRSELNQINNQIVLQDEAEAEAAAEARLAAEIAGLKKRERALEDAQRPALKLRRESAETAQAIQRMEDLGTIDHARAQELLKGETDRLNEALGKLDTTAKTTGGSIKAYGADTAAALANIRKAEADARAVEAQLDPRAAAQQRLDQQIGSIQGGLAGGVFSAERAGQLEAAAYNQLDDAISKVGKTVTETDRTFDQFFSNQSSKLENALVEWKGLGNLAKSIVDDIARMILRQTVLNPAASAAKSGLNWLTGQIGGWLGGGAAASPSTLGFSGLTQAGFTPMEFGGIMTPRGAVPLHRYASGGIADSPQLALFGEGRQPEAFVPLPDGRSIPVKMQGGGGVSYRGGDIHIHVANSNASAAMIAATARAAAQQENQRFIQDIQRGGSASKVVGRRNSR